MKRLDIKILRRLEHVNFDLMCSVTHKYNPEHVMVCTWGGVDAIRIEVNFTRKTTDLYMAGVLKGVYENLTIDEFVRLQCVCQKAYNAVLERFITKKNKTMKRKRKIKMTPALRRLVREEVRKECARECLSVLAKVIAEQRRFEP